jgi:hypothetical protein
LDAAALPFIRPNEATRAEGALILAKRTHQKEAPML